MIRNFIFFSLLTIFIQPQLLAKSITVAVAANFAEPMKIILKQFELLHSNIDTTLVIGSSGKLFAQIQQGAPFDLFLSADQEKPNELIRLKLAVPHSQFTYAKGILVLWSKQNLAPSYQTLKTFKGNLAIANPKLAPYGVAAKQVLAHYHNKNIQLISANNVIGAFQYIHSNSVKMGLIAKSSLIHADIDLKQSWDIDKSLYSEILQDLVIITSSDEVKLLSTYMKSSEVQSIIESFGYQRGSYE
ncbi:MAG: molybdate ABC transporter substrate-binding protein [Saccharospirillaceae bacterium]|nr:molybdate ABC transporter substrate-binding protein [Pseudomonadales bacterium]NRB80488.1 molybdate ABC transporter substrate-binding protein [Saccharospirillaceae bacterium]